MMMAPVEAESRPAESAFQADTTISVRLIADGRPFQLPDSLRRVRMSTADAASKGGERFGKLRRDLQEMLGRQGFLTAELDSAASEQEGRRLTFYADQGCRFRVSEFRTEIHGGEFSDEHLTAFREKAADVLPEGRNYYAADTERQIVELIYFWERRGYLFASVQPEIEISEPESCQAAITLHTRPGEIVQVQEQHFPNLERNRPDFLRRVTGIREGDTVTPRTLREARQRLEATGLFDGVDDILIVKDSDGYSLLYELSERRTNAFDLLFGYVPQPGGQNRFVGSGELVLRNLFFQGSRLDVSFERLSQFVTRLDLGYEATYLAGTPFGAGARFQFEQQDTLYQVRNMRLNGLYRLSSSTTLTGSLRNEVSVTGNLPASQQRVFDASAFFTGVGIRYRRTDGIRNPTRGLEFNILAETGVKRIDDPAAEELTDRTRWNQQEIAMHGRAYISPFRRQVISPSLNGFLMISPEYTETDFNRFGGAKSLRGFREDQFRSARMLWGDVEYRYLLDRFSHAFIFGASGYYERPPLIFERDLNPGTQSEWLLSYGLGIRYATPLGVMQISYALSRTDGFGNGNVHFGISAGL